jgi:hypothetical protein
VLLSNITITSNSPHLCRAFAGEEGKNYDLSGPLHKAQSTLKKILESSVVFAVPQNIRKAQISSALSQAITAASDASARDNMVHSDRLHLQQLLEKEDQAVQSGDIPEAKKMRLAALQFQSESDKRLNEFDACKASLSELITRANALVDGEADWPQHAALLRFDLPLQRLTTQYMLTKKWTPRFFILRGSRLYYTNGKIGHPDSLEGSLAFMRSNPEPDGHYCLDLKGACARCVTAVFCCASHSHLGQAAL